MNSCVLDACLGCVGIRVVECSGAAQVTTSEHLFQIFTRVPKELTHSNTNQTIVDMHHDLFNVSPPITLDEFHHYLYWFNRGWGDQTKTVEMVVSTPVMK